MPGKNAIALLSDPPLAEGIQGKGKNQQSEDASGNADGIGDALAGSLLVYLALLFLGVVAGGKEVGLTLEKRIVQLLAEVGIASPITVGVGGTSL